MELNRVGVGAYKGPSEEKATTDASHTYKGPNEEKATSLASPTYVVTHSVAHDGDAASFILFFLFNYYSG